jgi:hypothetical protein
MDAFEDASRELLLETLQTLLDRYPDLVDEASDILAEAADASEFGATDPDASEHDEEESDEGSEVQIVAIKPIAGTKRKADGVQAMICIVCNDVFDEVTNTARSCVYHSGILRPLHDSDRP